MIKIAKNVVCISLIAAQLTGQTSSDPVTKRTLYSVECATCKISLTEVATLGRAGDLIEVGERPGLARDTKGRYFAIGADLYRLVVFDSTGRFLRGLGRRGDGPGEFGGRSGVNWILVGPGDTLHVFNSESRIDLFSPDFQHVRTVRLPGLVSTMPHILSDGQYLIGSRIASPALVGFRYHQLDKRGMIVRSFWKYKGIITPTNPVPLPEPFAVSADEKSFWTTSDTSFTILRHSLSSGLTTGTTLDRVPWFRAPVMVDTVVRGVPRRLTRRYTTIVPGGTDSDDNVWLIGRAISSPVTSNTVKNYIEIYNPRSERIVATALIPVKGGLELIPRTDLAFSTHISSDGVSFYTIWRLKLLRN